MTDHRGDAKSASDKPVAAKIPVTEPLMPQAHGGALRRGWQAGNPDAPGRPPAHIRLRALTLFERNLKWVDRIMKDPSASNLDRLRALDLVGRYGLGASQGVQLDQVRDRLRQTLVILETMLPPEFADAIMTRIEEVWQ